MPLDQTKELVHGVLKLGEAISAVSDGLEFADVAKLVEAAKALPVAVKDADKCLAELAGASAAEKEELKALIAADFDIPNDQLEVSIEAALKLAVDLSELLGVFGVVPAPAPAPVEPPHGHGGHP